METHAHHVKSPHKSVGRRLPPAVSLDECRRKRLVVSGIQNPALRRDTVRLRHCGRAQSQSKARGLWRGSNREHSKPKKKDGEGGALLLCAPRTCRFAMRFRSPPKGGRRFRCAKPENALQGFRTPLCAGMRCGCGAAAGRKASPKPEGFGGVRIGNHDTKRKTSIIDGGFLLVHLQGFEPGTH